MAEVLLRRGARVCPIGGGPASTTTTPLHLAVRSNKLAVVMVLLAGGANPHRKDPHGWSPRVLANECNARLPAGTALLFFQLNSAFFPAHSRCLIQLYLSMLDVFSGMFKWHQDKRLHCQLETEADTSVSLWCSVRQVM